MNRFLTFLIAILGSLSMMCICVYADDCSLGKDPEGVYALENNEVTMTDEDIKIYPFDGSTECTFEFLNSGEEKDVLMGFPNLSSIVYEDQDPNRMIYSDFKAYDGSTSLKITPETSSKISKYPGYSSWFTFSVHFKKGEKKIIKNTYKFNVTMYSTGDCLVKYIIDTGSVWKDKIGHAKVTYFMPDMKYYEIKSLSGEPYFRLEDRKIIWERNDFEPSQNIEVLYNTRLRDEFIKELKDEPQMQEQYENSRKELEDLQGSIDKMEKSDLIRFIFSKENFFQDGLKQYALQKLLKLEPQFNKRIIMKIGDTTTLVNGIENRPDQDEALSAPEIRSNRTFVPLRFIVENMGGDVQWDEKLKKITINNNGKSVVLKIGEATIWDNGIQKNIDAVPVVVNGRTIVPARFIAESLGLKVDWFGSDQIILISGKQ